MNLWLSGHRQGSIIFIVYRPYSAKLACLHCIAKRVAVNGVNSNSGPIFKGYCSLRAIRKTALSALSAASQLIFAHEMALPSYIHAGRFSCEHEICPQECTSEL